MYTDYWAAGSFLYSMDYGNGIELWIIWSNSCQPITPKITAGGWLSVFFRQMEYSYAMTTLYRMLVVLILTIGDSYRATNDDEESYLLNSTDRMTL